MKLSKLNIILLFTIAFLLGVSQINKIPQATINIKEMTAKASPTPTPKPTPIVGIPHTIIIDKIGLNAPIDAVNVDEEGAMEIPSDPLHTGWYSLGYRPGEYGRAAIDGHLDQHDGSPAIFWNLWQLEVGDLIKIVDDRNKEMTFEVTKKEGYEFNNFPIDQLVGKSNEKILTLVTCTGQWNQDLQTYSHRMLITSKLISVRPYIENYE